MPLLLFLHPSTYLGGPTQKTVDAKLSSLLALRCTRDQGIEGVEMDAIGQPLIGRRLHQTSRNIIVAETEVPRVSISLQEIERLGVVGLREEGRVGSGNNRQRGAND